MELGLQKTRTGKFKAQQQRRASYRHISSQLAAIITSTGEPSQVSTVLVYICFLACFCNYCLLIMLVIFLYISFILLFFILGQTRKSVKYCLTFYLAYKEEMYEIRGLCMVEIDRLMPYILFMTRTLIKFGKLRCS